MSNSTNNTSISNDASNNNVSIVSNNKILQIQMEEIKKLSKVPKEDFLSCEYEEYKYIIENIEIKSLRLVTNKNFLSEKNEYYENLYQVYKNKHFDEKKIIQEEKTSNEEIDEKKSYSSPGAVPKKNVKKIQSSLGVILEEKKNNQEIDKKKSYSSPGAILIKDKHINEQKNKETLNTFQHKLFQEMEDSKSAQCLEQTEILNRIQDKNLSLDKKEINLIFIDEENEEFLEQKEGTEYPTPWRYGMPRGSVKELVKGYRIITSYTNNEGERIQELNNVFFKNFSSKQETCKAAEEKMQEQSDTHGLTRNKIRFTDKDTIQVELTQGQIMTTDAIFLRKINLYPLQAKLSRGKYYVNYQDKKTVKTFIEILFPYIDIAEYIDEDTLNLRRANIQEFGAIKKNVIVNKDEFIINQQYKIFNIPYYEIPIGIPCLGKPAGTIFKRDDNKNIWTARVSDKDNKSHEKTFNIKNYSSSDEALEEARKWQIETSFILGMTKNLITVVDDNTITINITKDKKTKTDFKFINEVQNIPIFATKSSASINSKFYAACKVDGKNTGFHNYLSGFNYVDHIDGNPLNNMLKNLDYSNSKNNNNNRCVKIGKIYMNGVTLDKDNCFRAQIHQNGGYFSKYFGVNSYGFEKAQQLACLYRHYLDIVFECKNGKIDPCWTNCDDLLKINASHDQLIEELRKTNMIIDNINTSPVLNIPFLVKYLDIDFCSLSKTLGFDNDPNISIQILCRIYRDKEIERRNSCLERMNNISKIISKKISELNQDTLYE